MCEYALKSFSKSRKVLHLRSIWTNILTEKIVSMSKKRRRTMSSSPEYLNVVRFVTNRNKIKEGLKYLDYKSLTLGGLLESHFTINGKKIIALLDTGANRSLIPFRWFRNNFSMNDISSLQQVKSPRIFDAQNKIIRIFASFSVTLKHKLSNDTVVIVDIYAGRYPLIGTNCLCALGAVIRFTRTSFNLTFEPEEDNIYLVKNNKSFFVAEMSVYTLKLFCPELSHHRKIDVEVYHDKNSLKYIEASLVRMRYGYFYVHIKNPSERRLLVHPFMINVRILDSCSVKKINEENVKNIANFLSLFPNRHSNLDFYENDNEIDNNVFHLTAFYDTKLYNIASKNIVGGGGIIKTLLIQFKLFRKIAQLAFQWKILQTQLEASASV